MTLSRTKIKISTLETSFRGYARKEPDTWSLHYRLSFACVTRHVPSFLSDQLRDVKGFFKLPQHSCTTVIWGQFEKVHVSLDCEIGLGPHTVWHTHGEVTVQRDMLWDAWAQVKFVYTFPYHRKQVWFKADVAFRMEYGEFLFERWNKIRTDSKIPETSFYYFGRNVGYSIQVPLSGIPKYSSASVIGSGALNDCSPPIQRTSQEI